MGVAETGAGGIVGVGQGGDFRGEGCGFGAPGVDTEFGEGFFDYLEALGRNGVGARDVEVVGGADLIAF